MNLTFPLFKNRRKQLLSEPFPDTWLLYLQSYVRHYRSLEPAEQAGVRDIVRVMIAEKNWEGCKGLELNADIQVSIAGQAALLLAGMEHDYFANVETILVYPASYVAVEKVARPGMVVTEVPTGRLGEAWSSGPVVLSCPDALAGGRGATPGRNVVLHEFAHKLDFRDGASDGVPRLRNRQAYDRWSTVMSAEFNDLAAKASLGEPTLLNQYGATNPAEFFAVSTECFFEQPRELNYYHPNLYAILRDFYGQNPAMWQG